MGDGMIDAAIGTGSGLLLTEGMESFAGKQGGGDERLTVIPDAGRELPCRVTDDGLAIAFAFQRRVSWTGAARSRPACSTPRFGMSWASSRRSSNSAASFSGLSGVSI